jgi:hypothetical protein
LGAALCAGFIEKEWIKRTRVPRQIVVVDAGRRALKDLLGIEIA